MFMISKHHRTPASARRAATSTLLVAAVVIASCGGDSANDTASGTTVPPAPTEEVSPTTPPTSSDPVVTTQPEPGVVEEDPSGTSEDVSQPEVAPPTVAGSDPLIDRQWGLGATQIPQAWTATGGQGVTIAIVDSGVDLDHPDLVDRLVPGRDFVDGDDRPDDPNGHGTHVAGIAAASSNDIGIAGAAPLASIMPVRVLDGDGAGSDDTIAEAVLWAAANGADVINLSLGESGFISRFTRGSSLNRAIRQVAEDGVVVIAAAGNEGTVGQQYRIGVDVLVVNATDSTGSVTAFSNVGDVRSISAPGAAILSTAPVESTAIWPDGTDGYAELDGTSMATPLVSGIAALALSAGVDPFGVIDLLADTAANVSGDPALGAGIVDAGAAVGVTEAVPDADIVPPSAPAPSSTLPPVTAPASTLPDPASIDVEELVRQTLEELDTTLDASCTVERRSLVVSVATPANDLGVVVSAELLVAGFVGAGSYPATGIVTATIPGQAPVPIPVAGTADVDDAGAGSVTVPLGESSVTLAWRCV